MFHLSKWYCDCVDDGGALFIGYWARVHWGPLVLPYAATLVRVADEVSRERYTLLPCPEPDFRDPKLRWESKRIGISASWSARRPGFKRTLLHAPRGSIEWDCRVPSADGRIDLDEGGRITGLGYAEHLRLTILPWQLPFEELRWGRFLSADDTLAWIEWRGARPRRWAFHNGTELGACTVSPGRIDLPGEQSTLEFAHPVVVRQGTLLSGPLRAVPWASLLLRRGLRHAEEAKWLARGTFTTPTRRSTGWVIHEIVRLRRGEPC